MLKRPLLLVIVLERCTAELRAHAVALNFQESPQIQTVLDSIHAQSALVPSLPLIACVIVIHHKCVVLCKQSNLPGGNTRAHDCVTDASVMPQIYLFFS